MQVPTASGLIQKTAKVFYAAGGLWKSARKMFEVAIALIKKELARRRWPEQIKGDYTLVWHYDIQSLLLYYGGLLSLSGLERLTGIHQKTTVVIYARTFKTRIQQKQRIEKALHSFANELADVSVL